MGRIGLLLHDYTILYAVMCIVVISVFVVSSPYVRGASDLVPAEGLCAPGGISVEQTAK